MCHIQNHPTPATAQPVTQIKRPTGGSASSSRYQPRIAPLSEAQPHRHLGNSPVVKFFEILPR